MWTSNLLVDLWAFWCWMNYKSLGCWRCRVNYKLASCLVDYELRRYQGVLWAPNKHSTCLVDNGPARYWVDSMPERILVGLKTCIVLAGLWAPKMMVELLTTKVLGGYGPQVAGWTLDPQGAGWTLSYQGAGWTMDPNSSGLTINWLGYGTSMCWMDYELPWCCENYKPPRH